MTSSQNDITTLRVHPLSGGDPHGTVFIGDGRVFRGVVVEAQDETRELFEHGVIDSLIATRLIPNTWISEIQLPGFPLVLEQEHLPCLTYSYEWTFSMLRDAGELVLDLREALNEYGYDLKDAHPDNITFNGTIPLWMDIGSFTKDGNLDHWSAEMRYRQSFIYPLQIWSRYGDLIGRRMLVGGDYISFESAVVAIKPWTRFSSSKNLKRFSRVKDIYNGLYGVSVDEFREKASRIPWFSAVLGKYPLIEKSCHRILSSKKLPYRKTSMSNIKAQLHTIHNSAFESRWKDYHSNVLLEVGSIEGYPRFVKVIEILNQLKPASVTDIGANQGLLARFILDRVCPKRVIAIDIDGDALDDSYCANRRLETSVYHAVLDITRPVIQIPKASPEERLRSEAVVALAVTHHMIISQYNSAEYTLHRIASFADKWLLIEYMPYGLHTIPVEYKPPLSYSVEKFEAAFRSVAEIMGVYELEPTRILYVGRKKLN